MQQNEVSSKFHQSFIKDSPTTVLNYMTQISVGKNSVGTSSTTAKENCFSNTMFCQIFQESETLRKSHVVTFVANSLLLLDERVTQESPTVIE